MLKVLKTSRPAFCFGRQESSGVTPEEIARKLNTKKSAISRVENHSEDICLSTLRKYAEALGKEIRLEIA